MKTEGDVLFEIDLNIDNIVINKIVNDMIIVLGNTHIKYDKYGEYYSEIIQHKWDMRKLNRKLNAKLTEKGIKEGVRKI